MKWVNICPNCMIVHLVKTFLHGDLEKRYIRGYGACKYCGKLTRLEARIK